MKRTTLKRHTPLPRTAKMRAKRTSKLQVAVKVFPDGRQVCQNNRAGRVEYARRRTEMWWRDLGICCICHTFVPFFEATFEHKDGRGMGGARRDDRTENNGIAHAICNQQKGSKRTQPCPAKPKGER
jgi:hypothetical protein